MGKEETWGTRVEPLKTQLGLRIKGIRVDRGLSQGELAVIINSSTSLISNIENGTGNPRLSTLCKIAIALKVDLSTLTAIIPPSN